MSNALIRSFIRDKRPALSTASVYDILDEMERMLSLDVWSAAKQTYPPYNIVQVDKDNYTVEVAVAGFDKSDILVYTESGVLHIKGSKGKESENEDVKYLARGIANRKFSLSFSLADDLVAKRVELTDGMLYVDLNRVIPEEKKPKYLEIK